MSPFAINGEAAAAQRVRQPTPTGTHKVRISLRAPGTAGIKQLDAPVNLAGTRLFEGAGSTKRPPAIYSTFKSGSHLTSNQARI